MKSLNLNKLALAAVFGTVALVGTSSVANAQGNSDRNDDKRAAKQQEKSDRNNAKDQQKRQRDDMKREAMWKKQNDQIMTDQRRHTQRNSGNDRSGGMGYIFGNANANTNRDGQYRVYRNGSYYQTDYQGVDILKNAVNEGYRQGFQSGRNDRNNSRMTNWSNSTVYRNATTGYQSHVTRDQYQHYFRQGFQRGYQDGSNMRYDDNYSGQYQYGYQENGSMNVLESILNTVFNIRRF